MKTDKNNRNPHKKETVFKSVWSMSGYVPCDNPPNLDSENTLLVVKTCTSIKRDTHKIAVFTKVSTLSDEYIVVIGDDLKANFDDPKNKKWIDLTK